LKTAFTDDGTAACAGSPTTTGVGDYNLTYNYDKTGDLTSVSGTVEGSGAGASYSYTNANHVHAVTRDHAHVKLPRPAH
jgi:hypothetical protein